jgi:hypothetical protein
MAVGKCLLTGKNGTMAKAHLTPLALTEPAVPGCYFIEGGGGGRPIRSHTSWYDKTIVTHAGEKVLAEIDDWAIKFLREHKLVWSGWGEMSTLPPDLSEQLLPHARIRAIESPDLGRLRLFFLSLLWRWAAASIKAAKEIVIPQEHLEEIGRMILSSDAGDPSFYAMTVVQLSSKGPNHNLAPFTDVLPVKYEDQAEPKLYRQFRFYLDGLIVKVFVDKVDIEDFGPPMIGFSDTLVFPVIDFEQSFQSDNMRQHMIEAELFYPDDIRRLASDR